MFSLETSGVVPAISHKDTTEACFAFVQSRHKKTSTFTVLVLAGFFLHLLAGWLGTRVGAASVGNFIDLGYLDRGMGARRGPGSGRAGTGTARAACTAGRRTAGSRIGHRTANGYFLADMLAQLRSIGTRGKNQVIRHAGFVDDGEFAGRPSEASFD